MSSSRKSERRDTASQVPDDHVIVLFGATGDLAKRKLLPGLFHLANAGLLPRNCRIVGSAPAKSALRDEPGWPPIPVRTPHSVTPPCPATPSTGT
ncbi:hypothetical protein ACWGCW_19525 [Streptomyces sp. NPDC054933]